MNIYEIDREIMALVDPDTGEISDFQALNALQMDRDHKVENVVLMYKNHLAEAAAIKAEMDALKARKERADKRAESAKRYLEYALNGQPFTSPRCEVSYRKSTRVEIFNTNAVVDWLRSSGHEDLIKTEVSVGKSDVGKLIKAGAVIPSVGIVESMNMGVK